MTLRQPDGGEPLPDDACLADYGVGGADEVELELVVAYRTEAELQAEALEAAQRDADEFAIAEEEARLAAEAEAADAAGSGATSRLPEVLRVHVKGRRKGEPSRTVTVRIDASGCAQPRYLGGFRDRRDGTVYHHASNQTIPTKPRECGRPSSPPRRRPCRGGHGRRRPRRRRPRRWLEKIWSWTRVRTF